MEKTNNIDNIISNLDGARKLTALELNDMRFSVRKTVITPKKLRPKK
ncbi:MAG: hypothetical protein K2K00_02250 [Muribaculaceae bacterium]|nr:hypothetical protein [Muribaculaceae bacterium]MDE5595903.1 hypothetical protein [Muribaculaceae bacterium]MDE6702481.1 hypothetical protein [Muribaculaceae bacterium]